MAVKSDIEIAREAKMKPIAEVGAKIGVPADALLNYGPYKAKVSADYIRSAEGNDDGKLIGTVFAKPMPGMERMQLELDHEGAVRVVDTIRVWGRFADGANVTSRYFTEDCLIPEPGTALLLAGGLLGLAAVRRSGFAGLVV